MRAQDFVPELLCALLNIRSEEALYQAPAAGAIWETFIFAQLRERERRAGNVGSVFFWRDRTREVDFLVEVGGLLELFEAKWTEVPAASDGVNLEFVRNVVGGERNHQPHTKRLSARQRTSGHACHRVAGFVDYL